MFRAMELRSPEPKREGTTRTLSLFYQNTPTRRESDLRSVPYTVALFFVVLAVRNRLPDLFDRGE